MDDSTYKIADLIIKAMGYVFVLMTIFVGSSQFKKTMDSQFQLPYLEKQFESCELVIKDMIKVLNNLDGKTLDSKNINNLRNQYIGNARLYLNHKSLSQLQDVMNLAYHCKDNALKGNECSVTSFSSKIMGFAYSCRKTRSKVTDSNYETMSTAENVWRDRK